MPQKLNSIQREALSTGLQLRQVQHVPVLRGEGNKPSEWQVSADSRERHSMSARSDTPSRFTHTCPKCQPTRVNRRHKACPSYGVHLYFPGGYMDSSVEGYLWLKNEERWVPLEELG